MCTSSRNDRSLERIVIFKCLGELHKEWTEVTASRATTHRRILDMGFKCRIPLVKSLLNNKRQKHLTGLEKKRTGLLLSGPKSSF